MKRSPNNQIKCLTAALAFTVGVVGHVQGQGFGGGGFGGGGGGQQAAQARTSQTYNPSGGVGNASISVNPDTGDLTILADDETTRRIIEVIQSMDQPQPQVLIKVVFMEITHNDSLDFGIEGGVGRNVGSSNSPLNIAAANALGLSGLHSAAGSNAPLANVFGQPIQSFVPVPPGAGLYQVLGTDFQATLRAIATAGKAEVLSRPSVLARHGQPANIHVGQSIPIVNSSTIGALGNQASTYTYRDVGITLMVTPYITSEGMVQMIVQPEISSLDPTTTVTISPGVNVPVITRRAADTVVITPDGQTIVIGGLMQNSKSAVDNKIPLLGDIPVLGHLFKRKIRAGGKTELMIFLTPHVVQAPTQVASLSELERQRSLTPKSYSEEQLNRFLDTLPPQPAPK